MNNGKGPFIDPGAAIFVFIVVVLVLIFYDPTPAYGGFGR